MRRSLFCSVLCAAGCTSYLGWRPLDQPTPVEPHDLVWIWSRGVPHTWHAVVFSRDSVSGIPYWMPLKCDSCRLSLPLAQVDTMRLGHHYHDHNVPKNIVFGAELVGIAAAALLAEGLLCYIVARNDPQC